jgi:hypothetical protein
MRKEMRELIQKEKDTDLKVHLTVTTLDDEQLTQVWHYLQALVGEIN